MNAKLTRALGVCYYPEHWPQDIWRDDARRMKELGLTYIRIGEFSWAKIEPKQGQYEFDWLDEAIDILGAAGLKVVLGTPTATPPRWMIDKYPDMLAVDHNGLPRKFGSRRHYCFSHQGYQDECAKIVQKFAERYGKNPHIDAWQTDNEYGCHDTVLSYSNAARLGFVDWLKQHYQNDISALNAAWGNIFWSITYDDFEQIDLPNLTVTEPNPSHMLAFRKFSSDQVVRFNKKQSDIIRTYSDAPITHNYMGRVTEFDHFKVGDDLDFASWDSYPLGFLEDRIKASDAHKCRFARQGDPDFQAFHHDLYRAVGKERLWVMEQQPGPVNWAPHNPAPHKGMVRLWAWEAFAHGADAVCFFRWRQLPFAQEQMHSGLLRPDSIKAESFDEVLQIANELKDATEVSPYKAPVALMFDYEAEFAWDVQPHGAGLRYFDLVFDVYKALRALGLSIDIISPKINDISAYKLVLMPGIMHLSDYLKSLIAQDNLQADTQIVLGPRTGARTDDMQMPVPLAPAVKGLNCSVRQVESLRPDMPIALKNGGYIQSYREFLDHDCAVIETTDDGEAALVTQNNLSYLAGWPDQDALRRILGDQAHRAGLQTQQLPDGLRCRETGNDIFWFNYDNQTHQFDGRTFDPLSVTRMAK